MCGQMIAKHISHGYDIMFITVNSQAIHSQVLRKKSFSMSLYYVLKTELKLNYNIMYAFITYRMIVF